jgi:hypothetical protein
MVSYDDMTPEERDRFIYLTLSEDALKSIVLIMQKRHGPDVSTDTIMRFAFKVAVNRMTPKHLKESRKKEGLKTSNNRDTPPGYEA